MRKKKQHEVVGDACRKMAKRSSCSSAASRAHGNGAAANLATGIAPGPLPPNFPPGGYIGVLSSFLVHVFFFCFFYKVEKTCTITMGSILIDLLWTLILQPTLPTGIAPGPLPPNFPPGGYIGVLSSFLVHVFFFCFFYKVEKTCTKISCAPKLATLTGTSTLAEVLRPCTDAHAPTSEHAPTSDHAPHSLDHPYRSPVQSILELP